MAIPVMHDQSEEVVEPSAYDYEELLIDGDLLVFSSCAAVEYGRSPEEYTLTEILQNIESRIHQMRRRLKAKKVRIFFTDEENFRYKIMPEYKSNRVNAWIPDSLHAAKSHITVMFHGEKVRGLEADDLLAINQKTDGSTIVATIDKDIPQIRGHHYRWETPHRGEKIFVVEGTGELVAHKKPIPSKPGRFKTEIKGNGARFFCYQLLVGDPTDGVMGCGKLVTKTYKTGAKAGQEYTVREGIGPVQAYELLEYAITYQRCMEVVIHQYKHHFGDDWENQLLRNGRCLYMVNKRRPDGKFLLWHFRADCVKDSWYDPATSEVVRLEG